MDAEEAQRSPPKYYSSNLPTTINLGLLDKSSSRLSGLARPLRCKHLFYFCSNKSDETQRFRVRLLKEAMDHLFIFRKGRNHQTRSISPAYLPGSSRWNSKRRGLPPLV